MAVGGNGYDHGFGPYQTIMTSRSRSRLERDHSKVGSSGRPPHLLALRSLPVLQVSTLYDNARSAIHNAVTPIWGALPSVSDSCVIPVLLPISENFSEEWTVHIEVKCLHFSAASQYRKSIDDTEHNKSASARMPQYRVYHLTPRYGHEVARLAFAQSTAKSAFDKARRGASKPVMEDVKACYRVPF